VKRILLFFMIILVSCSNTSEVQKLPTPISEISKTLIPQESFGPEQAVVKPQNSMIFISEENYEIEIRSIIGNVSIYDSRIGQSLMDCEIGKATSDGYEVSLTGDGNTCLILFVPANLTNKRLLKELAPPSDSNEGFTVALTKDMVGYEYPFIFVGEREFDFFYLTRVFAHEAIHMINIKNQADCTLTPVCEEFNAYQTQFKILEDMYSKDLLNSGVNSYALSNSSDLLLRALDMELFLYQKNKEGKLEQALIEMRYNSQGQ